MERVKSASLAEGTARSWTAAATLALTASGAGPAAIWRSMAAQIAGSADGSLACARAEKQVWKPPMTCRWPEAGTPATVSSWRSLGRADAEDEPALTPSRPKKMTPTAAIPSAAPTCWAVARAPEAEPASAGLMPASTTLVTGAMKKPPPAPATNIGTSSCQPRSPVPTQNMTPITESWPTIISAQPTTRTRVPSLLVTAADRAEPMASAAAKPRVTAPALTAL